MMMYKATYAQSLFLQLSTLHLAYRNPSVFPSGAKAYLQEARWIEIGCTSSRLHPRFTAPIVDNIFANQNEEFPLQKQTPGNVERGKTDIKCIEVALQSGIFMNDTSNNIWSVPYADIIVKLPLVSSRKKFRCYATYLFILPVS